MLLAIVTLTLCSLSLSLSLSPHKQPRLGGEARPVQRPQAKEEANTTESGFNFLSRSSKGSAFDFVKEEMDIAKKK